MRIFLRMKHADVVFIDIIITASVEHPRCGTPCPPQPNQKQETINTTVYLYNIHYIRPWPS
jgi:hypothetical protein